MTLTPGAHDLLTLIAQKDIPTNLCEFRPKIALLNAGYAVLINELTNTLSEKGGVVFMRRVLHITTEGREYLTQNKDHQNE